MNEPVKHPGEHAGAEKESFHEARLIGIIFSEKKGATCFVKLTSKIAEFAKRCAR